MSSGAPVLIAFPIDQFVSLIIAILVSALGVVFWVYKQTHPLDTRLGVAEKQLEILTERMTKAEAILDDFRVNYQLDINIKRVKEIWEKERDKKEAQRK
jgi:hypothetical protein